MSTGSRKLEKLREACVLKENDRCGADNEAEEKVVLSWPALVLEEGTV